MNLHMQICIADQYKPVLTVLIFKSALRVLQLLAVLHHQFLFNYLGQRINCLREKQCLQTVMRQESMFQILHLTAV